MCVGGGSAPKEKESQQERALAEVAAKEYADYQTNYVPFENEHIASVKGYDSQAKRESAQGRAATTAKQGLGSVPTMDPNSAGFKQGNLSYEQAVGGAAGQAQGAARQSTHEKQMRGMVDIVGFGRQQNVGASKAMQQSAYFAAGKEAADAQIKGMNYNMRTTAMGELAGAGIGYGAGRYMGKPDANPGYKQSTIDNSPQYDYVNPRGMMGA